MLMTLDFVCFFVGRGMGGSGKGGMMMEKVDVNGRDGGKAGKAAIPNI